MVQLAQRDRPRRWRWHPPESPAGRAVPLAGAAAGLVASATLPLGRPGLGWLLTALAVAGCACIGSTQWRSERLLRLAWAVGAVALLAVGVVRAAGWLYALCVPVALLAGAQAPVGGRTVRAMLTGVLAVPVAAVRALPWAAQAVNSYRRAVPSARLAASGGVTLLLVLVFGALLTSADPAFAHVVDLAMPSLDASGAPRAMFLFTVVGLLGLAVAYLARSRPCTVDLDGPARPLRTAEWVLPVALVDVLFAGFVLVQLTVLFGGHRHVLDTAELTYAQYARGGFWQLLVVTGLTLGVLAGAARWAPRTRPLDRVLLRVLLGTLAGLTLVIVASALRRMALYEDAYGYTRLRVFVMGVELWLGLLFVLVLVAGVRIDGRWLPRLALGTAVAGLLALAVLNPDRFIAAQNVDRYARSGRIDFYYLGSLSADAVPELARLPEPQRSCALALMSVPDDDWRSYNLARVSARAVLGPRTDACRNVQW